MRTLVVVDQAPYGNWTGREALDMVFSLAAFDQPAALLFLGTGVNWLRAGQNPEAIGQKSLEKNLAAAPVFGVSDIYACETSCRRFGLDAAGLAGNVTLAQSVLALINTYDQVVFAG